ncbi:MAG TPA: PEGA domain-containing protein, partial [Methanomicrobiales archaeon]|nr:PEGA domain-containing protein [Methanomicrobiales archaeon]
MIQGRTVLLLLLLLGTLAAACQALTPLWVYRSYGSEAYGVAVSSDGSVVAAALDKMYLFTGTGEKVWAGYGGEKVAMSDDGSRIAAGTYSDLVCLDGRTGRTLWSDEDWHPVDEISMSGDGQYIGAIGGSALSLYTGAGALVGRNTTLAATALAVAPDGSMMVAGTPDAIMGLSPQGGELWGYESRENREVRFARDGSFEAAVSGYTLLVFDTAGDLLWKYQAKDSISDIAISAGSGYIVAGSHDRRLALLDRKGALVWSRDLGDPVSSVAISGDGSSVAAGTTSGSDKKLYLFNLAGDLAGTCAMEAWVKGVAFSPDGFSLAAVTDDGNLYYFSLGERPEPTQAPATVPALNATTGTPPAETTEPATTATATPASTTTTEPPATAPTVPTPKSLTGFLKVDSSPEGADIYVDHKYIGTTPMTSPGLAVGTHRVGLIRSGYAEWGMDVEVT